MPRQREREFADDPTRVSRAWLHEQDAQDQRREWLSGPRWPLKSEQDPEFAATVTALRRRA